MFLVFVCEKCGCEQEIDIDDSEYISTEEVVEVAPECASCGAENIFYVQVTPKEVEI